MAYHKAPHHRGPHQRLARITVQAANARPGYRCPTCGLTRTEGIARWGKQGEWDAGHVNAGEVNGKLRAEHRHCNRSHGAKLGNSRRSTGYDWP